MEKNGCQTGAQFVKLNPINCQCIKLKSKGGVITRRALVGARVGSVEKKNFLILVGRLTNLNL